VVLLVALNGQEQKNQPVLSYGKEIAANEIVFDAFGSRWAHMRRHRRRR
jgi:hypothetical protein